MPKGHLTKLILYLDETYKQLEYVVLHDDGKSRFNKKDYQKPSFTKKEDSSEEDSETPKTSKIQDFTDSVKMTSINLRTISHD